MTATLGCACPWPESFTKSSWRLMWSKFAQLNPFPTQHEFLGFQIRESPKPKQISAQKIHTLLSMDKAIFQARYYAAPKFLYALQTFPHTKLHFLLAHQSSLISPHPLQVNAHQHSHHPCLRSNLNNFLPGNTTPKLICQASLQDLTLL